MKRTKRVFANLVILSVIYFSVDALLVNCRFRFSPVTAYSSGPLPNHWLTLELFAMFGVFDGWRESNLGYVAYGVKDPIYVDPLKANADVVDLRIYDYFPDIRWVADRRVSLSGLRWNPDRVKREYVRMADIIQRLHNEAHPERKAAQVFIYRESWPKSPDGYWKRHAERTFETVGYNQSGLFLKK